MVAYGLLMFIGGMTVPTRYGIERLEGFGRFMAAKIPYRPEPGKDEETAMQEATGNADEQESGQDNGGN
ncbi:hypothetical protein C442_08816 [Haloarcula amylolytica JCM 13557]|uniref:Uncharacterized protein n=2 Tax=Haloarcula amylolytica TaxID=396317 RepID=M0KTR1_9EURY|nr:hypothetical protein C442_08816 [Haloarcula amylolytica JCM 13557]